MPQTQPKFITGSTMRHVTVMALTGSLGMSFMFLVDAATLFWIGRLHDSKMMAAVGFAGNVLFFTLSAGIGMMIATVVLVSRNLGAGKREEARAQVTSALMIAFVLQSLFALLMWFFRDPILLWAGASGETLAIAETFLTITLLSLPAMVTGMVAAGVLRAVGDAKRSMYVTLVSGFVAMVLDPLVIVYWGLGVPGAAWVWGAARLGMAVAGLYYVIGVHNLAAKPDFSHARRMLPGFCLLALPLVLTQLSTPFGGYLLTSVMASYGEASVAAWAVVGRLYMLTFAGLFALAGAVGGIFGQNIGAKKWDRVESTFRDALIFCAVYTLGAWALLVLASSWVSVAFGVPAEGEHVIRAFAFSAGTVVFTGALFVSNVVFNSLQKPIWSTGFNWLRDGVVLWPLAILLGGWFGASGVVYAQGVAAILVGSLATYAAIRYMHSLKGERAVAVQNTQVEPI